MSTSQTHDTPQGDQAAGELPASTPDAAAVDASHREMVTTSVEHLITGRELKYPIYDEKGVLLLAENSTVTPAFKDRLRKWNIRSVQLHSDDLRKVTLAAADDKAFAQLDEKVAADLNESIASSLPSNSGPAARNQRVKHQTRDYDPARMQEIVAHNRLCREVVNELMTEVVSGMGIDIGELSELATGYVNFMTDDLDSVLATNSATADEHDIADHCLKMALLGMAIGIELGLDEDHVRRIGVTGLVHDWGMARVPEEIRLAKRALTLAEFLEIKKHPIHSVEMLECCKRVPSQVTLASYQVHERPNGKGYPRNRIGNAIHIYARILNVADTYRALVGPQPFRKPLKPYAAMECLLRLAQSGDVDSESVRALLRVLSLFPIGSYVVLSDGRAARVIRSNPDSYTQPIVRTVQNADGTSVSRQDTSAIVDLSQVNVRITQALATPGRDESGLDHNVVQGAETCHQEPGRGHSPQVGPSPFPSEMERVSLETYSDQQQTALWQAIEAADRSEETTEPWLLQSRKHERLSIRRPIEVRRVVREGDAEGDSSASEDLQEDGFRALARDVSQGGLSFLHPQRLEDSDILIGLEMPGGGQQWFESQIVRRREIPDAAFWEYGVAFRRRINH